MAANFFADAQEHSPAAALDGAAPLRVREGVVLLPRDLGKAGPTGRPPNGYAVAGDGSCVLMDAPSEAQTKAIRDLAAAGFPPRILLASHWHAAQFADDAAVGWLREMGCALAMAGPDSGRDEITRLAAQLGLHVVDPADLAETFAAAGLEIVPSRGHTLGHRSLYHAATATLLAGDAAVGEGPKSAESARFLAQPPAAMCEDEPAMRQFWRDFDRPLSAVLPLHGALHTDAEADFAEIVDRLRANEAEM